MTEGSKPMKLTQSEMVDHLSPAPFDQRNIVPKDATIKTSPDSRWWRSDSPDREGGHPDVPLDTVDPSKSATRGVLGTGRRDGPGNFQSQYQTGSGTAAHFKPEEGHPRAISGYSGHIAGKYAGNVIGGTFDKSYADAEEHLKSTSQAKSYPGPLK